MCTITATEFRNNFGKYNALAQKETIIVTSRGKEIYSIIPQKLKDLNTFLSYVGSLPNDATIGVDPDERG